jgi:hypothetical protein
MMKTVLLRVIVAVSAAWALLGCGGNDKPAPSDGFGVNQSSIIAIRGDTLVTPGTLSTRTRSCPHNEYPDRCGTWDGIELSASFDHDHGRPDRDEDEHCFCRPIAFQLPATLPVSSGNAGSFKASLSFRKGNGRQVECRYKGNRESGRSGKATGGEQYIFERCSDGSTAGSIQSSDWFELELEHADHHAGPTVVNLRLGEADVVGGVVQDTVYFSDDSRISNASLTVPRGAAPANQEFRLAVLNQISPGMHIANGGNGLATAGYAVNVEATGLDDFTFTTVAGASCARIELPYSATLLGSNGPETLGARQILDVTKALNGQPALAIVGDVLVDVARRTLSFCAVHLSFYAPTRDTEWNNKLVEATLIDQTGTAPDVRLVYYLGTTKQGDPLPLLYPGRSYTLRLQFKNTGSRPWAHSGTNRVQLTAVERKSATEVIKTGSPFFPNFPADFINHDFTPSPTVDSPTVANPNPATFTQTITTPTQMPDDGLKLNLCTVHDGFVNDNYFGECFSWDLFSTASNAAGDRDATIREICDYQDNDGDALIDEGVLNACGGCTPLAGAPNSPCDNGRPDICFRSGTYQCDGINAVTCNAQINGVENECGGCTGLDHALSDTCDNGLPGTCTRAGTYSCLGTDYVYCNAQIDGVRNRCSGCTDLGNTVPGTGCNNGEVGSCWRNGVWECMSGDSLVCNAPAAPPRNACGGCGDLKFAPGSPCDNGRADDCRTEGSYQCSADGGQVFCDAPRIEHCIKFRMDDIDDDAFLWDGIPVDTRDAICEAHYNAGPGSMECNLSLYMASRYGAATNVTWCDAAGNCFPGARDFTLMLGNGGCFDAQGKFSVSIDGGDWNTFSQQGLISAAHCGWVHAHRFVLNFAEGSIDPLYRDSSDGTPCGGGNPHACCLPTDCTLPFLN